MVAGPRPTGSVRVELLSHEGCPLVEHTRALLRECLAETGLPATVVERVGAYPSPSVLVEGRDVMGGAGVDLGVVACRLDPPTRARVIRALRSAVA